MEMDIKKMIGEPSLEAMPEPIRNLMQDIIEGNVRQFVIVTEFDSGLPGMGYHIIKQDEYNPYAMSGAIMAMHRDYTDAEVPSGAMIFESMEDDQEEDDDAEEE